MRLKEHWDASERGMTEKLAVVEHEWENHHRETTGKGGSAHSDNTCRGVLQSEMDWQSLVAGSQ